MSGQDSHNSEPQASAPNPGTILNAQQMDAIQKRMIAEFQKAVDDVEMRKIAVDAACKILPMLPDTSDPVGLIRQIYAFMLEPAAEIVVKVS